MAGKRRRQPHAVDVKVWQQRNGGISQPMTNGYKEKRQCRLQFNLDKGLSKREKGRKKKPLNAGIKKPPRLLFPTMNEMVYADNHARHWRLSLSTIAGRPSNPIQEQV